MTNLYDQAAQINGETHRTNMTGSAAGSGWECGCGAGSKSWAKTPAIANAARQRHLASTYRAVLARLRTEAKL